MTDEPEYMARAIRAGCGGDEGMPCNYPKCLCIQIPKVVRAAAPILMDEAIKGIEP